MRDSQRVTSCFVEHFVLLSIRSGLLYSYAMKSAGLSSTYKRMLRQTTKISVSASLQANHLAAKEKQKSLRMQAEAAQIARQKRENENRVSKDQSASN